MASDVDRRDRAHRRMYLRMITKSFWNRLSRAVIASLSIAVGAAALSGLGIVAFTVPDQLSRELRSYGANIVALPEGGAPLDEASMEAVDGVLGRGAPEVLGRAPYSYGNLLYNMQPVQVMGTELDSAAAVRPYWQVDGERPDEQGEILVGATIAERYRFGIGDRIGFSPSSAEEEAAPANLRVSGIVRTGSSEDEMVIMALDDLAAFQAEDLSFDVIEYSVDADQAQLDQLTGEVNSQVPDVDAEVVRRIAQSETGIAETLQSLIWLVSAIIVALTLISVSTTLQTIVAERAKEIGLKKALGATARDITREFLGEAVLLGLVGGVLGLVAGITIAGVVTRQAFNVDLIVSPWVVPITLGLSALISAAGSLLPARRIAAIRPSIVLGGE